MDKTSRPSSLSRTLALVPPAVALVAQQASGAFDVFLKMGTITGEATTKGYEGYIEIESFSWGVSRAVSLPPGGADRETSNPSISEITVSKRVDGTSPAIFLNAVGSTPLTTVTLVLVDSATAVVHYKLTLTDVLVSSQQHSGASGNPKPAESLSLNFTKIKIESLKSDGKMDIIGWDLTKNTKI